MAVASPPRTPLHDDPEALIPEARERQRRRRLLGAAALAMAAAVGLGIHALSSSAKPRTTSTASASGTATTCPANAVPLSLQTQGTATQAVIFLTLRNPHHLRCSITAPVVFEITENGHRAPVSDNPLRARLHVALRGARTSYWPLSGVWWANWCGSGKGLRMTARVGSQSMSTRLNVLPDCFGTGNHSKLRLGT